ncbi:MAG: thiolase family protein [Candidatus Eisenbacteria bacterium]
MKRAETDVVIAGAARTPIGKHGGYYNHLSAEDLGVIAVREALARSAIDTSRVKIDQVIAGMIYIDSRCQHIYLPRNVATRVADQIGDEGNLGCAPGKTTLRICGTGFQVAADAYDLITGRDANKMNCIISFGTESMSQTNLINHGRRKPDSVWDFDDAPTTDFLLEGFNHYLFDTLMPKTADKYGKEIGITREECDKFACLSHDRSKRAQLKQWNRFSPPDDKGYLKGSFEVDTTDQRGRNISLWRDEGTRYDVDFEGLSGLRPLLGGDGLVTPGNASQISDGAASVVLLDRAFADKHHIPYIARISGYNFATVDPEIMGQGPVPAIKGLLEKLNLKLGDVDLFEVNEAFAPQYLAVEKELGLPRDKTNVNGGAIAVGHNIAATGLRMTIDLVYELRRRGERTGIASACIGGGQGGAICVEVLD